MGIVQSIKRAVFSEGQLPQPPNRATLSQHLRVILDLESKRQGLYNRDTLAQHDIAAADQAAALVQAKQIEIDQMRAVSRYLQEDTPEIGRAHV